MQGGIEGKLSHGEGWWWGREVGMRWIVRWGAREVLAEAIEGAN